MEAGLERKAGLRESREELAAFKQELTPVFEGSFAALGHGTNIGNAPAILKEGLRSRTPLLQTTTVPLENTPQGMNKILHWPHHDHKAIIVVAIPFDTPRNAEFFDEVKTQYAEELPYVLPSRFIRGYIDVEKRKFVPNPAFESNPAYKLKSPSVNPFDAVDEPSDVQIPQPKEGGDTPADIF